MPERFSVFIYALIDPRTSEIRYVGKAFDVKHRVACHWHETNRWDTTRKCNWVKTLKRIGLKPEVEILESFIDTEVNSWQDAERWWISYLRAIGCNLTNLCSGGVSGNRMSAEAVQKLKVAHKGKTVSPEVREKIRKTLTGRKLSAEHIAKIAAGNRGKTISEEQKAKLRDIHLGRKRSLESRQKQSRTRIGIGTGPRGPRPNWVRKKLSDAGKRYFADRAITADGKTQSRTEWSRELCVAIPTIVRRLRRGMTAQEAIDDIRGKIAAGPKSEITGQFQFKRFGDAR